MKNELSLGEDMIHLAAAEARTKSANIFSLEDVKQVIGKKESGQGPSTAAEIISRLKQNSRMNKIERASRRAAAMKALKLKHNSQRFGDGAENPIGSSRTRSSVSEEIIIDDVPESTNFTEGGISIFQELTEMSEAMQRNRSIITAEDYLRDPMTGDYLRFEEEEEEEKPAPPRKHVGRKEEFGECTWGEIISKAEAARKKMATLSLMESNTSIEASEGDKKTKKGRKGRKRKVTKPKSLGVQPITLLPSKMERKAFSSKSIQIEKSLSPSIVQRKALTPSPSKVERKSLTPKAAHIEKPPAQTLKELQAIVATVGDPPKQEGKIGVEGPANAVQILAGGNVGIQTMGKMRIKAKKFALRARKREAENQMIQKKIRRAVMKSNTFVLKRKDKKLQRGKTISELRSKSETPGVFALVHADRTAVHITARTLHIQLKKMERKERARMAQEDFDAPVPKTRNSPSLFKKVSTGKGWNALGGAGKELKRPDSPDKSSQQGKGAVTVDKSSQQGKVAVRVGRNSSRFLGSHLNPQSRNQYSLLVLSFPECFLHVVDIDGLVKRHQKFPYKEIKAVPTKLPNKIALYHHRQYITLANVSVWKTLQDQYNIEVRNNKPKAVAMWAGKGKNGGGPIKRGSMGTMKRTCGMERLQILLEQSIKLNPSGSLDDDKGDMAPSGSHNLFQFVAPSPRQKFLIRPRGSSGRIDPSSTLPTLKPMSPFERNPRRPLGERDQRRQSESAPPPYSDPEPAISTSRTMPDPRMFFPDIGTSQASSNTDTGKEVRKEEQPEENTTKLSTQAPKVELPRVSMEDDQNSLSSVVGTTVKKTNLTLFEGKGEEIDSISPASSGRGSSLAPWSPTPPLQPSPKSRISPRQSRSLANKGPRGFAFPNTSMNEKVTVTKFKPSPPAQGKSNRRQRSAHLGSNYVESPVRNLDSGFVNSLPSKDPVIKGVQCDSDIPTHTCLPTKMLPNLTETKSQPSCSSQHSRKSLHEQENVEFGNKFVWDSRAAVDAALVNTADLEISESDRTSQSSFASADDNNESSRKRRISNQPTASTIMSDFSDSSLDVHNSADSSNDDESTRIENESEGILILLVDSQPEYKLYFQQNFQMVNPKIYFLSASSSKEALQHLQKYKPDFVLLNWLLKDSKMSPLRLCEVLRAEFETTAELPIIVYMSGGNETLLEGMRQHGVTDFLSEPYTQDVLKDIVDIYHNGSEYRHQAKLDKSLSCDSNFQMLQSSSSNNLR